MKVSDIVLSISLLLILLFAYTATSKLLDMEGFRGEMLNQPLPEALGRNLVWSLPVVEVLAAALLMVKSFRLAGLCLAFLLMTAFTGYIALIMMDVFGRVPCSCGGALESLSWPQHLVLNILFWLLSAAGIILEIKQNSILFYNKISR